MANHRNDMEFDNRRSEIFMERVNGLLLRSETLPADSFTANAVLGHYLWTYRPSTPEDENPDANKQKEREGWVVAMHLGNRTLREIAQAVPIGGELRPDQRSRITANVVTDTAAIIRAEQSGSHPSLQPRQFTPEEDALASFGIKERVENLYHNGYIQSAETALGIVLLAGVVDPPKSLSQEKLDKLKLTAKREIGERLTMTRNVARQSEGIYEGMAKVKRLVGYERDGIAPQTIDQMVADYTALHGGQPEIVRNHIEHEIANGLGHLFNPYIPQLRKYA
jgi:hypothetical protein